METFNYDGVDYCLRDFSPSAITLSNGVENIQPAKFDVMAVPTEVARWVARNTDDLEIINSLLKEQTWWLIDVVLSNSLVTDERIGQWLDYAGSSILLATNYSRLIDSFFANWTKNTALLFIYYEKFMNSPNTTFMHSVIKQAIAANYTCPQAILKDLANEQSPLVLSDVVRNPNCPEEVLTGLLEEGLAATTNKSYTLEIFQYWNYNFDTLMKFYKRFDERSAGAGNRLVNYNLALNSICSVEMLEVLADNKDWMVRLEVAKSFKVSSATLFKLASDVDEDVRDAAVANPNCTMELLLDEFCEF